MKKYLKGLVLGLIISLVLPGIVSAHTIHFETLGDKQFSDITVADDGSIDLTKYVPELEGYMFDQWTTNSDYSYGGGYESWPGDYYYHVSKDMTFYAYFYDRVYTYAYNKTTGKTDKFAGAVLDNGEDECVEAYCTVLEPYNEEWNTLNLEAKANPGFKFVEWRVGYSMPAKTHIRDNYQGLSYNETKSAGTNAKYTDVGGKGFITVYAVFEEDPNSNVKLVTEAHATMEEPVVGGTIKSREEIVVTSTEPSKYSVETGGCWAYENSSNCLLSGKFEEGQSYELYVILKPAEGYRFNENTKLYVNDKLVQFDTSYEPTGITNMYGNVVYSFSKPEPTPVVTTKPGAPKIKVADGQGNALVVNWPNNENVTRYEVYRSTDKKKWTKFNSNDASSYESRGLTYGKTYYYRVKACNSAGCSNAYSNIVSKKVIPDKVTGVKVSGSTNNLKVSWDKVSTTGYEVYMNGKKITTIKKNGTLSFNKKKLKANTTYKFKVRAYKTVGKKKIYGPFSSTITSKTAPAKPSLSITLKDYATLVVKQGSSKGASKYVSQVSADGKTYEEVEELEKPISGYVDTLEIGESLYIRVKACNSYNNCSGWTIAGKKVTTVAPSYSLKTTSKKVTITLKPVNGADGYEIHRATKKKGKYTIVKDLTSDILIYNNGTKKGKTYYYKVRSYKMVNSKKVYSPFSSIKSIKSK